MTDEQPTRKSMLDHLRDTYDAVAEALRPKPGPILAAEPVRERGMEEPRPKDRWLDTHHPAEAEKIRQAEPMREGQDGRMPLPGREEKPTQLKHELTPEPPKPTFKIDGTTHTNTPTRQQTHQPAPERGLSIDTNTPAAARSTKPMVHERLIGRVENKPPEDVLELARARLAAVQEADKAKQRGTAGRSLFDDYSKGRSRSL